MSDYRKKFSKTAEELLDDISDMLKDAVNSKKEWAVTCRYCKKSARYPFPNYEVMIKAAQFAIDNGFGKPAQQKAPVEEKKVESKKLEDLSDDELFALLESLEDESGKTDGSAA